MNNKTDSTHLYGSGITSKSETLFPGQTTYSQPSSTASASPKYFASTNTNEWHTPALYVAAVSEVLHNRIELDPASSTLANKVVRADRYYTIAQDGLAQPWNASSVFLNPPYGRIAGKSQAGVWSQRLIAEYNAGNVREAVLLVNGCTSERWFQPLFEFTICFTNHRIRFNRENGKGCAPTKGSAFVYLGTNPARFASVFAELHIGRVVVPISASDASD